MLANVIRVCYSILLYCSLPFIVLKQILRGVKTPENRPNWRERFGWYSRSISRQSIWLHAVSVGEVMAAAPLIEALLQQHPNRKFIVTTMTRTGRDRVKAMFGERVTHVYAPYDVPGASFRFIRHLNPVIGIIFETELWPNWLLAADKKRVPVLLLNARMSERSALGYKRVGIITRQMLNGLAGIAAQTQESANRLIELGAPEERVIVAGSSKYSMSIKPEQRAAGDALRNRLGADHRIWVAASTHDGEDELVLAAFESIRKQRRDVKLIIVPRHPERFSRVAAMCERTGLTVAIRSQQPDDLNDTDILVGDTMGEMMIFYAASDIAFVGGSLVPIGGHNVLEPAAAQLPVIVGPNVFNFERITRDLMECGGGIQVLNKKQLAESVLSLVNDPEKCRTMGEASVAMLQQNQGTIKTFTKLIDNVLAKHA